MAKASLTGNWRLFSLKERPEEVYLRPSCLTFFFNEVDSWKQDVLAFSFSSDELTLENVGITQVDHLESGSIREAAPLI